MTYLRHLSPLLASRFAESGENELLFLAHEEQAHLLEGVHPAHVSWVRGLRPVGFRRFWWERQYLPRFVRKQGIDVLFTPYQVAPRVPGIRNVMMIRNMEPFLFDGYPYSPQTWLRNVLLRRVSSRCLREADRVIAVSQFASDHLTLNLGMQVARTRTVYHGSVKQVAREEMEELATLARIGVAGSYILTCGSLLPYRRCEDVIAAFNKCVSSLPEGMRLVIAGSGADRRYQETIRQAIKSSGISNRIMTLGHVSSDTMVALYRHCAACVIATEIEACPNIAIEAMANGCVIVSSNRPPLPEMFQGCSLEYRARDIDHLAYQIQMAVDNDVLRSELRALSLKRSKAFSWQKCARETYSALVDW